MTSFIQKAPDNDEIERVVNDFFPSADSYRTLPLSGGLFNTAYILTVTRGHVDSKYVLRFGPVRRELLLPYEHNLMASEAWAYEKMAEAGIPTSVVYKLDTSKSLIDRDVMAVEYIDSVDLSKAGLQGEERDAAYEAVGRYCRRMNTITTEKFGRVSKILNGGGFDFWSDALRSEFSDFADSVRLNAPGYYTDSELEAILSLTDRYRRELDMIKTPMFNHCDIWELNILMRRGSSEIAAVIDPDRCLMGDPDFELASGWMMNDAFYRGYGRRFQDDGDTRVRVGIYKILFLLLNGYFTHTQYEDKSPSMRDKKRAMELLESLV